MSFSDGVTEVLSADGDVLEAVVFEAAGEAVVVGAVGASEAAGAVGAALGATAGTGTVPDEHSLCGQQAGYGASASPSFTVQPSGATTRGHLKHKFTHFLPARPKGCIPLWSIVHSKALTAGS